MNNILIFSLFFTTPIIILIGKTSSTTDKYIISFGLFSHINYNIHSADFRKIPDCPSCLPGYDSGIGLGPIFGIMSDYKVADKFYWLTI